MNMKCLDEINISGIRYCSFIRFVFIANILIRLSICDRNNDEWCIGKGGFGMVFKSEINPTRAIKVLHGHPKKLADTMTEITFQKKFASNLIIVQ